ncbi:MAG: DUF1622 domain-containing protein [Spirulina sp.]
MELIEHLRQSLNLVVDFAVLLLEAISIFCVLVGLLKALLSFPGWNAAQRSATPFLKMRTSFGRWLSLALEFQLAADILGTTIEPSFEELIRLSIVAVVRTFLNYFLEKEMLEALKLEKKERSESRGS